MEREQVLHDAAEVYVNDLDFVREQREGVLNAMYNRPAPFVTEPRLQPLRTRLEREKRQETLEIGRAHV